MPDRLAELVRQRALVQEHLAWLEREIAAASASSTATLAKSPAPAAASATANPSVTSGTFAASTSASSAAGPLSPASADADKLLEEYRVEPAAVKSDVRKGCLLYFAAALVLLAVGVAALYFLIRTQ